MQENYNKAYTEALVVLNNSNEEILKKIPEKILQFLNDNMDRNYIANIDFYNPNWENTLMDETKGILGLIYRDYIVSIQQRTQLLIEEQKDQLRFEKEENEKYDLNNIFKSRKKYYINEHAQINESNKLIEIKKESYFKKILNKILSFFKIK